MSTSPVMLHCSSSSCRAPNEITNQFCQECGTPLVRRYLWGVGGQKQPGELVDDRYLVMGPRIFLDLKPGEPPNNPEEVPDTFLPYLKLITHRLHIPQIYGQLDSDSETPIWLLEYGPITNTESFAQGDILPTLKQVWSSSPALRQLNWLWQMARLWEPLKMQSVASSLLVPHLLRINGSIIQLLELQGDWHQKDEVLLDRLGQFWQQLVPISSPLIRNFLEQLCEALVKGQICTSEDLVGVLEWGLGEGDRGRTRTYQIYTCTDRGVVRDHNEDDCYPPPQQLLQMDESGPPLAIVCDGIGGHEGGEIASGLAVETIREVVTDLRENDQRKPGEIIGALASYANRANDRINERNDSEHRQERRRMGTTLVMTLAHHGQMYYLHVGDSRLYWLEKGGCRQLTVDDDVASRDVRLGYSVYRTAITYPGSGALTQALGMTSSSRLYATTDRLIIDDDCLFLLCSDGLSDGDRVEQYWETELLPILTKGKDLPAVGDRLIQLANDKNGHDNITVALVYCQVKQKNSGQIISFPSLEHLTPHPPKERSNPPLSPLTVASKYRPPLLPALAIFLGLVGVVTTLSYFLFPEVQETLNFLRPNPTPTPLEISPSATETPDLPDVTLRDLVVKNRVEVLESITLKTLAEDNAPTMLIPANTILEVSIKQKNEIGQTWLLLKVCSVPQGASPSAQESKIKEGWLKQEDNDLPLQLSQTPCSPTPK